LKAYVYPLVSLTLSLFMLLGGTSCNNNHVPTTVPENTNLLAVIPFTINATPLGLGSSVQGAVFVSGRAKDPTDRHLQVIATLQIDPFDWSGVAFTFTGSWEGVTGTSSYPEGSTNPEKYLKFTSFNYEAHPSEQVTVGNSFNYYQYGDFAAGGGGKGSLSFELSWASSQAPPPAVIFTLGIGGQYGVPWRCTIRLEVPMALEGQLSIPAYTTNILEPDIKTLTAVPPGSTVTIPPVSIPGISVTIPKSATQK
jgi:hypothetical protein